MIKTLNVPLDEKVFKQLQKKKGTQSWSEFLEKIARGK